MTSLSPLKELADAVDGPLMMQHMREFARWTKHAGTPEELESLKYIEAAMKSYGFRTELILHDAYISLPGKARVVAADREFKAITHSFSRPAPAGLTAAIVDVGAGSPADFAKADVRGKIVLVDGIANPVLARRSSEAGAAGELHVSPHEHTHEMCISPVWGSPTHETLKNLPKTVVATIPADAGAAIRAALAGNPALQATIHAEVDTGWRKTPILVADLPGPRGGEDEPFVLFTGHHDTWYYGVMDNGGANATMIEVARLAASKRAQWRRGLRVIFWSGHSQGRYSSSSWYADANWEELERRALVHVNVDSTGGQGNTVVADTSAAAELRNLAREALATQADQVFAGRRMSRAGDQSFWGIGVPSIFGNMGEQPATAAPNASAAVFGAGARLGHGTGWWWHTPDDLLDKIDEPLLVRDTKIYMHVIWRLLSDPVLPLDYAEHASYLKGQLEELRGVVGDRFDLSLLISRAEELKVAAEALSRGSGKNVSERNAGVINAAMIAVARELVHLDYSTADRFEQDPAVATGPYPSLAPLRRMAEIPADSDEFKFLTVGMTRARNRVAFALRRAVAALDTAREALSHDIAISA